MADTIQQEADCKEPSPSSPRDNDHSTTTRPLSPRTSLEAQPEQTSRGTSTPPRQSLSSRRLSLSDTAVLESELLPSRSSRRSSLDTPPLAKDATRLIDRLGWWPATLLVLSLVLLVASVTFLSWIWFVSRDNPQWRNLMLSRYNTIAVTITTFLVRLAFSGITWVTAAMMASIVTEQYGIPDEKVAEASIARYTGSIVSLVLDRFIVRTSWFRVLVPAQALCTVLSQLSSTLLFSDFRGLTLPGFPGDTTVKYEFDPSEIDRRNTSFDDPIADLSRSWQSVQPQSFEPFAEHSRPEERIVDNDMLDDTGSVWRAFLPYDPNENNTNINEYAGPALVVDSRTMCVRPDILNLTLQGDGAALNDLPRWVGRIRVDSSRVPNMLHLDNDDSIFEQDFICSMVGSSTHPDHWNWVQCKLTETERHRVPTLDPLYYNMSALDAMQDEYMMLPEGAIRDSPKEEIISGRTGRAHMLLGTSYGPSGWGVDEAARVVEHYAKDSHEIDFFVSTLPGEGPWNNANVSATADGEQFSMAGGVSVFYPIPIRVTYCWDVLTHQHAPVPYMNVTASGERVLSPPVTSWNSLLSRYDTHGVRSQLGATAVRPSPQSRAVLALTRDSLERAIENEVKPADVAFHARHSKTETPSPSSYPWQTSLINLHHLPFAYEEDSLRPDTHVFWIHLLEDIIEDTGSPALAIQAINTAASRMKYTHWMGSYTMERGASITRLAEFNVPVEMTGYAIVMVVVATQVALLVVVSSMFKACNNTVLHDAWLAVSQVSSSPEAVGDLVRDKAVTDADVGQFIREEGTGLRRRRLLVRDGAFRRAGPD